MRDWINTYESTTSLLRRMTELAIAYQDYVRAPSGLPDQRLEIAQAYRKEVFRRAHNAAVSLDMMGHDSAAAAVRAHARATEFVKFIEYSWEDPDFDASGQVSVPGTLEIDVQGSHDIAVAEIICARELREQLAPARSDLVREGALVEAALMIWSLYWIGADCLLELEDWLPVGYDDEDPDTDRLAEAIANFDALDLVPLILELETEGLFEAARLISRMRMVVSEIAQQDRRDLGDDDPQIVRLRDQLDVVRYDSTAALLTMRPFQEESD